MAELIIHGGSIVTMDEGNTAKIEAIAIKYGRILAIGIKEQVFDHANEYTEYVQLNGNQTLLPGFIEPHQHAIQQMLIKCLYTTCSAYYYHSYSEIRALFESTIAAVDHSSQQWCIFFGWDPEILTDLPRLSMDILDNYSKVTPIVVIGQNGHVGWANSKAFELAGVTEDVVDPAGGIFVRDPATGKLTGKMLEVPPLRMVLPSQPPGLSVENITLAFNQQWNEYASAGFTTVTDLLYMPNKLLDPLLIKKCHSSDCPIRLALYQRDVPNIDEKCDSLQENDKLWIAGVKLMADGSPHCGTAAVKEEYRCSELTDLLSFPAAPNYGKLNYSRKDLLERVRFWHSKGEQIAIHAHGEAAIEQALDVLEEVQFNELNKGLCHRLEHLGLCEEKHIEKAAKLGISLSFFVQHLYFYATSFKNILGLERTNRWAPLSLAVKHNALWTLHQDHPTFPGPPEPFANLMTAITRTERYKPETVYGPQYCISIEDALKGYTINAAKQIDMDKELGSLTVGKRADLVVLSDNPLKVDPFKLVDIKVLDTYLDGRSNGLTARKESRKNGKLVYTYN